ncbi:hypothetical protein K438DRAFT_1956212 [Mycena galopus ATCC 62051]|nr:hypothetical protein K438DRAFT_1956212 [Mycena galopus ATCC 62051]
MVYGMDVGAAADAGRRRRPQRRDKSRRTWPTAIFTRLKTYDRSGPLEWNRLQWSRAVENVIDKLSRTVLRPPDLYPNPALAYRNAQLQATAFGEEFDAESFQDLTAPKVDMTHKGLLSPFIFLSISSHASRQRAGKLLEA